MNATEEKQEEKETKEKKSTEELQSANNAKTIRLDEKITCPFCNGEKETIISIFQSFQRPVIQKSKCFKCKGKGYIRLEELYK